MVLLIVLKLDQGGAIAQDDTNTESELLSILIRERSKRATCNGLR